MIMKVGVHPNNLHLQIASLAWTDARDRGIEFIAYKEGRSTGKLIAGRRIDVGGTGSTPPLIAQSEGIALAYVAASAPREANGAIVVLAHGGANNIADLAGRRVALLDGSFHTYFLAAALEAEGLSLSDVTRVELAPNLALAALREKKVGAWIAMEPQLSLVRGDPAFRVIGLIGDYVTNRSVFWASRDAVDTQAVALTDLLRGLADLGRAIGNDPGHYAQLLADAGIGGNGNATWREALSRRDWRLQSIDDTVLDEQQAEADVLFRHGALSSVIDVRAAAHAAPLLFTQRNPS